MAFSPAWRASVAGSGRPDRGQSAGLRSRPGFELVAPGKGAMSASRSANDTGLAFRDGLAWQAAAVAQHVADEG